MDDQQGPASKSLPNRRGRHGVDTIELSRFEQIKLAVAIGTMGPRTLLPQYFADPALGQLILAHNTLGVDTQQHVDAVPSPLRYLGSGRQEQVVLASLMLADGLGTLAALWPHRVTVVGEA